MTQQRVFPLMRIVALLFFALSLAFTSTSLSFAATRSKADGPTLIGPKARYLALGDSLAFGFQSNGDFSHGYSDYFYKDLKTHGVKAYDNLSCSGESTITMINGICPLAILRKYPYLGPQLQAAVNYLHYYAGQVSPVTLDIGANDYLLKFDINPLTCTVSSNWPKDLARMDTDLTQTILPALKAAMTVNGQTTGDLILLNYYDPFQNLCPNTVPYSQLLNQHLIADASGYATVVDIFDAFGGATTPNPNICTYTWMCVNPYNILNIHATNTGYQVMAQAIEQTVGY